PRKRGDCRLRSWAADTEALLISRVISGVQDPDKSPPWKPSHGKGRSEEAPDPQSSASGKQASPPQPGDGPVSQVGLAAADRAAAGGGGGGRRPGSRSSRLTQEGGKEDCRKRER
ncbi:hypothetical protein P7K49_001732, partial [Saguinus oedipus]